MIQRKQTLYLILAIVAIGLCLFFPIGVFPPQAMGGSSLLYNLGVAGEGGSGMSFLPICLPLFMLLAVSACISLANIFMFKNLKLQQTLCQVAMLFDALWCIDFALFLFNVVDPLAGSTEFANHTTLTMQWAAVLPLVALVFTWLAHRGIKADINLIKAADRIR